MESPMLNRAFFAHPVLLNQSTCTFQNIFVVFLMEILVK